MVHSSDIFDIYPPNRRATPAPSPPPAVEGSVLQPRPRLATATSETSDDHLLARNSLNLGVNLTRTSQGTPHRASTTAVGESLPAAEGSVSKSRPRLHSSQGVSAELDPLAFRDSEPSLVRAELASRENTINEAIARSRLPPLARDATLASDREVCLFLYRDGHDADTMSRLLKIHSSSHEAAQRYLAERYRGEPDMQILMGLVEDDRVPQPRAQSTTPSGYSSYKPQRARPVDRADLASRSSRSASPRRRSSPLALPKSLASQPTAASTAEHAAPSRASRPSDDGAGEIGELQRLIHESGYLGEPLTRLIRFVVDADGPAVEIAYFFLAQARSPRLALLHYDRVVSGLLSHLRLHPEAVHSDQGFRRAWDATIASEIARLDNDRLDSGPSAIPLQQPHASHVSVPPACMATPQPSEAGRAGLAQALFQSGAAGTQSTAVGEQSGCSASPEVVAAVLEHATQQGWVVPTPTLPASISETPTARAATDSPALPPDAPGAGDGEEAILGIPVHDDRGTRATKAKGVGASHRRGARSVEHDDHDTPPAEAKGSRSPGSSSHRRGPRESAHSEHGTLPPKDKPARALRMDDADALAERFDELEISEIVDLDELLEVPWFDTEPSRDRRSNSLQRAKTDAEGVFSAFLHRESRRRKRMSVATVGLTPEKIRRYFRTKGRAFASQRGDFHTALLDERFDAVAREGDLARACKSVVALICDAAYLSASLQLVHGRLETLARGAEDDEAIERILAVIDHSLLPSGDSDNAALFEVCWHPSSAEPEAVRTAYALLDRLHNLASVAGREHDEIDEVARSYFRQHVAKAQRLPNLDRTKDNNRHSLPDQIHNDFCADSSAFRDKPVLEILQKLGEASSSIGRTVLREAERRRGETPPPTRPPPPPPSALAAEENRITESNAAERGPGGRPPIQHLDIDLIREHAGDITLAKGRASERITVKLAEVPEFMSCELCNQDPRSADGTYGAGDIGWCPVCKWLIPHLTRSRTMQQFKDEMGGPPVGRTNTDPAAAGRKMPADMIIAHALDDCFRLRRAVSTAIEKQKVPASLEAPITADTRVQRFNASKARRQ